jgi:hypothetical protein
LRLREKKTADAQASLEQAVEARAAEGGTHLRARYRLAELTAAGGPDADLHRVGVGRWQRRDEQQRDQRDAQQAQCAARRRESGGSGWGVVCNAHVERAARENVVVLA